MPQPGNAQRHNDANLSDFSVGFMQDSEDAIMGNVFGVVDVDHRTDTYPVFDNADWNRRAAQKRAPGDTAPIVGYSVSTTPYKTEMYSVKKKEPREGAANADPVFDVELENTEYVTGQCMLEIDAALASNFLVQGVWDTDLEGVNAAPGAGQFLQWDDAASSPITDMLLAHGEIKRLSTKSANVMSMGYDVWTTLLNHPEIVDRIKHVTDQSITLEILARYFQVDKIVVAGLTNNTAIEGATPVFAFLVDPKHVGLFVNPEGAGKRTTTAGKVFAFNGGEGYSSGQRIAQWYDEDFNSDMTQCDFDMAFEVTAASAGAFLRTVVP